MTAERPGRSFPWDSGDGHGAGRSSPGRLPGGRWLTTRPSRPGSSSRHDDQAPADDYQDQAPAGDDQDQAQYAPPPADPADEIEHLAQLHASGVLTDDEFTAAKAKIIGS